MRSTFKPMFQLYLVLKSRAGIHPPTSEEIMYASGQKPFDSAALARYQQELESHSANIKEVFAKQQIAASVRLAGLWTYTTLLNTFTAALEPSRIRGALGWVDCSLRPAIRRSGETGIHQNDGIWPWSIQIFLTEEGWCSATSHEARRRYYQGNERYVRSMFLYLRFLLIFRADEEIRPWRVKSASHSMHGHPVTIMLFWRLLRIMWPMKDTTVGLYYSIFQSSLTIQQRSFSSTSVN